jgi:hypothetical protein
MLVDHKWMQAVAAVIALSSVQTYAAEPEQEESYYLSQMKALSQNAAPEQNTPAVESDVLAGTDLKALTEQDSLEGMEMAPEKPTFEKPKL